MISVLVNLCVRIGLGLAALVSVSNNRKEKEISCPVLTPQTNNRAMIRNLS